MSKIRGQVQNATLTFRLYDHELAIIKKAAKTLGIPVAIFVRKTILKKAERTRK